ncbi:YchJ family protein [Oceanospirillum sp.]|uniref:YchJ family protein n=1 Tax=Oceanospirillum sp. TaxID=2021254 RepID=UPI003A93063D
MNMTKNGTTSDQPCYCQSGQDFGNCCEKFITGKQLPDTPEQLMRSRYSAYVQADLAYIKQTTQKDIRPEYDFEGLKAWAENSEWLGLKVHGTETSGDEGRVRFTARYREKEGIINHSEDSKFIREEGQWFFVHGKDFTPVTEKNIGRNDPCPCGSGKKYKKCCLS